MTNTGSSKQQYSFCSILMFGIPLLTSYFYGRLMWPAYPWKYKQMTDAMSVLTAVYFLYLIGKALYLAWCKWSLEGSVQEVTEMLGAGEDFFRWTSKCLRLIQETELVARGFTLWVNLFFLDTYVIKLILFLVWLLGNGYVWLTSCKKHTFYHILYCLIWSGTELAIKVHWVE